ncbi:MMPL family transporter [Nocardia thailandica]|uniref:MMPL family transporter n=1 Tax=Nocardia thailandica TaxID=257275 RepID=A0ABW6PFM6_9NOCA
MFTRWGDLVYRFRFAVIGVVGAALLAMGGYGFGLEDHLSTSGWDDPGSDSAKAAHLSDAVFGRDHRADVIVLYTAAEGKTIDDPAMRDKVAANLGSLKEKYPDQIEQIYGTYWTVGTTPGVPSAFGSKDKKYAFASIGIVGDNDTDLVRNYRKVKDVFFVDGVNTQVTGLQAVGGTLNDTIAHDQKRMEMLAIPAVAVLLFFIFGGVVAAALPLIVGGLTILGANGIVMGLTKFTEVNSFVGGVVSMIGLGLAIDYGLFIVSRFREELAEGYDTRAAVRRSVMTAGRTVVFSATMIIASLGGMLLFPQGFLRSVAYGTIATVSLAALTAITILPAMLAILGPRIDMLGLKRFRKTKTAEEIENGFWGNMTRWVMKHPLKIAIPITIGLLLLIIPVKDLKFGGINERYLPPDAPTRVALEQFYSIFPQKKTDPIQLVFVSDDTTAIGKVWKEANSAPNLVGPFGVPTKSTVDPTVFKTEATLTDSENYDPTIDYLRSIELPDNVTMYVGGQPAIQKDSIDALLSRMPLMIALVLLTTTVLMFLTFGSLVLPIKAALMSALGLGSTLGILTLIFVDGYGADLLNFTPQPISAPVLMLIIAVIYGLSTDYEVFLLSRMVEARAQGASTTESVRIGTAQTGRIITAAALILLVVTGAFAFSDLVMMQYIAYGMIAALFIDATVLRMLLVPATMKLLGDDCWWAPKWMKRIQEKIGLGEPILDDELPNREQVVDLVKTTPITDPPTMQLKAVPDSKLARSPRRPRTVAEIEAEAPTAHLDKINESEPARARHPMSPDPTRPRASVLDGEPTRALPVVRPGEAPETPKGAQRVQPPQAPAPGTGSGPGGSPAARPPHDPTRPGGPAAPEASADLPGVIGGGAPAAGIIGGSPDARPSGDGPPGLPGGPSTGGAPTDNRPSRPNPTSPGGDSPAFPSGPRLGGIGESAPNSSGAQGDSGGAPGINGLPGGGPGPGGTQPPSRSDSPGINGGTAGTPPTGGTGGGLPGGGPAGSGPTGGGRPGTRLPGGNPAGSEGSGYGPAGGGPTSSGLPGSGLPGSGLPGGGPAGSALPGRGPVGSGPVGGDAGGSGVNGNPAGGRPGDSAEPLAPGGPGIGGLPPIGRPGAVGAEGRNAPSNPSIGRPDDRADVDQRPGGAVGGSADRTVTPGFAGTAGSDNGTPGAASVLGGHGPGHDHPGTGGRSGDVPGGSPASGPGFDGPGTAGRPGDIAGGSPLDRPGFDGPGTGDRPSDIAGGTPLGRPGVAGPGTGGRPGDVAGGASAYRPGFDGPGTAGRPSDVPGGSPLDRPGFDGPGAGGRPGDVAGGSSAGRPGGGAPSDAAGGPGPRRFGSPDPGSGPGDGGVPGILPGRDVAGRGGDVRGPGNRGDAGAAGSPGAAAHGGPGAPGARPANPRVLPPPGTPDASARGVDAPEPPSPSGARPFVPVNGTPGQRPPLEYIPPQSSLDLPGVPGGEQPGPAESGPAPSGVTPAGPSSRGPFVPPQADSPSPRQQPDPADPFPGFTPITTGGETARGGATSEDEDREDVATPNPWQPQAPAGFTAVPQPGAEPEHGAHEKPDEDAGAGSRAEIEDWMAQLRSARRPAADEGRHSGGEGRTVSVNELLRRREDETD